MDRRGRLGSSSHAIARRFATVLAASLTVGGCRMRDYEAPPRHVPEMPLAAPESGAAPTDVELPTLFGSSPGAGGLEIVGSVEGFNALVVPIARINLDGRSSVVSIREWSRPVEGMTLVAGVSDEGAEFDLLFSQRGVWGWITRHDGNEFVTYDVRPLPGDDSAYRGTAVVRANDAYEDDTSRVARRHRSGSENEGLRIAKDAFQGKGDTPGRVDIVVAYTPAAATYAGGAAKLEDGIRIALSDANVTFRDSNVGLDLTMVKQFQTSETPTGTNEEILDALIDPRDHVVDDVPKAVDDEHADVGILVVDRLPRTYGFSRILNEPLIKGGCPEEAFALVDCAGLTRNSLAHEIGHLLGCQHQWGDASPEVPLFPWGRGHVLQPGSGGQFRTLMAVRGNRLKLISDPTNDWKGQPLGVTRGIPCQADCVDAMRRAAIVISNYRVRAPSPPAHPEPCKP